MYERWRGAIVGLMAGMEASIDFGEEENIEDGVVADVVAAGHELVQEMRAHLDDARRGEIMRSGVSVAIVGPPNSGKSTLLNLLAQRQVAIVSAVAGTTRDIVEATLDVGGFPVVVRDTAGLRPTGDAVEAEGVRRALAAAQSADLRICVVDASRLAAGDTAGDVFGGAWRALLRQPHTLVVANKADLLADVDDADAWARAHGVAGAALLSCATRRGWDALLRRMAAHIRHAWGTADADARCRLPLTRARHRQHMQRCVDHMTRFLATRDVVLAAEELRAAAAALGRITGRTGTEDVLDALFSQFCIGK
ncbi:tRNA modification GTPase gtpbp3, mitochondrial [Coemansia sp. RSA 2322]|nr:tRNA modification GTPase gtpbp3, mitochondrial [Coemansia sp. RSA 2322]